MWLVYLCVFFVVLVIVDRWKSKDMLKLHKEIGTDIPYMPVLGHAHKLIGNGEDRMKGLQDISRRVFNTKQNMASFWIFNYTWIVVSEIEAANHILKSSLEKGVLSSFVRHLLGNGSIFAPVDIWRPRRKILSPLFGLRYINKFIEIFERNSIMMADELAALVGKGNISLEKHINSYSLDTSCETTMGDSVKSQRQLEHPFLVAFTNYTENLMDRMCKPWLHISAVYKRQAVYSKQVEYKKTIVDFVEKNIAKTRLLNKEKKQYEGESGDSREESKRIKTFLELLTEHSGYNDVELREEALILLLAATETTALSSGFTGVLLAHHPDIQDKVYEEIREVFENASRPLSIDDLNNLKYLDAVIKETMRLYPPGPVLMRTCDSNVTLPSGLVLPKGTNVIVNIWAIHRNPRYWGTDADEFKPERFLNAQREQLAAFMPFSSGPRSCLGYHYAMLTIKTNLAILLHRYRIIPATSFKFDEQNPLRVKISATLKHVHNFEVQLEHRH